MLTGQFPSAFSHWHPNADGWQYYIKGQGALLAGATTPRLAAWPLVPPILILLMLSSFYRAANPRS